MARDCRISLAVHEDTREKWKTAAEDDPHADSMAQLIRTAVTGYINEEDTRDISLPDNLDEQLTDLRTQQKAITRRLDEFRGQLEDVREAVESQADPETAELAEDVFSELPPETEVSGNAVVSQRGPEVGTLSWLSDRIDAPTYRIRAALDYLQESTYAVQTNGDQYYKEV